MINFLDPALTYRRKFGGRKQESLAKACGIQKGYKTVIDATAGLGEDGFILASLGFQVSMIERHPAIYKALQQAFEAAKSSRDSEILNIFSRLSLHYGDAKNIIPTLPRAEVILLDPMFPEREKSALVKQPMRILKTQVGEDLDADSLLLVSLQYALHRVIVKRPKGAPYLNQHQPDFQLIGKACRWDGYTHTHSS